MWGQFFFGSRYSPNGEEDRNSSRHVSKFSRDEQTGILIKRPGHTGSIKTFWWNLHCIFLHFCEKLSKMWAVYFSIKSEVSSLNWQTQSWCLMSQVRSWLSFSFALEEQLMIHIISCTRKTLSFPDFEFE